MVTGLETDVTDEAQRTTKKLVSLQIVAITPVKSTWERYEKIRTRLPENAEEEAGKHRRTSRKMPKKKPETTEEEAGKHRRRSRKTPKKKPENTEGEAIRRTDDETAETK